MVLPSGDQSGSLGLLIPAVRMRRISPPSALILQSARAPSILETKQIVRPSGDQHGEDSSSLVLVSCLGSVPLALATCTSGLPPLLRIIATRAPSGETAAAVFNPE